jgi:PEP-CTERM motif-containing protein
MQVVIPAGEIRYLFGKITSPNMDTYDLADLAGQGGIQIGVVPEPGTIFLLLVGSLCLLGIRTRKQLI